MAARVASCGTFVSRRTARRCIWSVLPSPSLQVIAPAEAQQLRAGLAAVTSSDGRPSEPIGRICAQADADVRSACAALAVRHESESETARPADEIGAEMARGN